ncbi:hypothetical protein MF406_04780 [Georgenia sp. TF02-10]|nr:hypothetical protein [Georgenia sp. TF02-10]UNX55579.1 hypothetical protein MF406_04780 [Georgenia sp. TF02-10]
MSVAGAADVAGPAAARPPEVAGVEAAAVTPSPAAVEVAVVGAGRAGPG